MLTALLWCDKMHKNKGKKLLHLTIEFFLFVRLNFLLYIPREIRYNISTYFIE